MTTVLTLVFNFHLGNSRCRKTLHKLLTAASEKDSPIVSGIVSGFPPKLIAAAADQTDNISTSSDADR